ncbi:DUF1499 domain-containing protein [Paenalkalicoccus suaedae]|uniref:DUF1499 domain-containing protein n=1 Tax=Paenalkalicoccus suaedae TaxID=2592382 RepID=UPI00201B9ACE|nr:DUF1499 domain-containing protein [Paenalkalicoccus suaedae]
MYIIILVALAALAGFGGATMAKQNNSKPGGLGVRDGKLSPVPKTPNAVSTQTDDEKKRVEPLPFKGDLAESKARIERILDDMGTVLVERNQPDYIHAIDKSKTMKFKDDLEFFFHEEKQHIDLRFASRVGQSDFGVNKKRYESIKNAYLG